MTSPLLKTVSTKNIGELGVGTGSSTSYVLFNFAVSEDEGEEEAWLDALEAGQVNERGYLPQKKDVSTLTARQVCVWSGHMTHRSSQLLINNVFFKEIGKGSMHNLSTIVMEHPVELWPVFSPAYLTDSDPLPI